MNVEEGMNFGDLTGVLRRRWPIVAGIAGVVFLISIFIASILPNEYNAYATILVEPQSISKRLVAGGLEETDLNARLNLMTAELLSRPRLSRIITDLEMFPEESKQMTREEVILLMRSQIVVEPVLPELMIGRSSEYRGRIDTFRIIFRSRSARTAAAVANRIANDFIEEHIKERVQVAGETSEFIENELGRLVARMQDLDENIARLKEENLGHLPQDLGPNQTLLNRSFDVLRGAQRQLVEAQSDVSFWEQQALITGTRASRDDANPSRTLDILELRVAELRSKGLTDKHPDMVKTQINIEEIKEKLAVDAAAAEAGEEEDEGKSLAQQGAEAQIHRAELKVAAARAEIEVVTARIAELEDRIAETPRVVEQLGALERQRDTLEGSFGEYSDKRLAAGVAANMERRQKGEQFRVLESAFVPPDPSSPQRLLIVALGVILGLALGAGTGLLLEALDTSYHEPRKLQTALRIPVLASIPGIVLEADRRAARTRQFRIALASSIVAGFVLTSSALGYVWVNGAPNLIQNILSSDEADEADEAEVAPAPEAPAGDEE